MWSYEPPLRDMQFVIEDLLDAPAQWARTPGWQDLDADTARQILAQAGELASGVLAPLNAVGDSQGCEWSAGEVRTPAGFAQAYRTYCEGGWPGLACVPEHGGQGLPQLLNVALHEMLNSANPGWTMYPGLAHGAYECLHAHASAEVQDMVLARIVSGEWLATMCLTEAGAGSDLGQVRTRARPVADVASGARAHIAGSKIFISGGEHDLTPNIVHLVLARLPDAPPGSKGLSLFMVPKILPDGSRNAVRCDGIEKKMGIKGSATCVLTFEDALGWRVGEAHGGLAAMFVMMNASRLHVGLQGLGHLEAAGQNALRYARERHQSRAAHPPPGYRRPPGGADPIVLHPAMRRTLWTLKAQAEGLRVIALWTALGLDEATCHPQAEERSRAQARVSLLTPIVKAFMTHLGHLGADQALQVWGGHGYMHEYGIEQAVRDSRIAMIYEGSNEIQAIDLLQRKVLPGLTGKPGSGSAWPELIGTLLHEAGIAGARPALAAAARQLAERTRALDEAAYALAGASLADPERPLRVADDFLHATGHLLLAWAWLRSARVAAERIAAGADDDGWHAAKAETAGFGLDHLALQFDAHLTRVMQAPALPWLPAL